MLHESTNSGKERILSERESPQTAEGAPGGNVSPAPPQSSTVGGSQENRDQAPGGGQASQTLWRRCALCGKKYQVTQPKLAPFCSERCQQVDLGNWLGEAYGLPWEDPAGGDDLGISEDV